MKHEKYGYPLAVVMWRDAYFLEGQEAGEAQISPAFKICVTAGWLIRETSEVVTLAMEYEHGAAETLRVPWHIERSLVESINIIRDNKPKPRKPKEKPPKLDETPV